MHRRQHNNLVFYQFHSVSQYPALAHGVFTRRGGVSPPPYESLNIGSTVGDTLSNVVTNRTRMAEAMSIRDEETRTTWQVHGAEVLTVRQGDQQEWPPHKADGIITSDPVPLVMRFADCVPIVLYDPVHGAVGLAHAGWRGTIAGAGPATVRAMSQHYGSRPSDIIAGIGPSIGPCCYEVGPEVIEGIEQAFGGKGGLVRSAEDGGGTHLDLWAANERSLREAGVEQIETAMICTSCRVGEFYSHRRERGTTGRFGAVIALRERA